MTVLLCFINVLYTVSLSAPQGHNAHRVQERIQIEEEGVQCHTLTDIIVNDGNLNNPLSNYFVLDLRSGSPNLEIIQPHSLVVYIIDNDSKPCSFVM